ncbi:MAG: hypothetical protein WCH57_05665 [Verrucomicrobiota bacterium]
MPISLPNFRERFHELVLSFLWRQWSAVGVAGQARTDDDWVIDPEALLLLTTTFGRRDPRLFDEVLDWLSTEGGSINLQRLKNLQTTHQLGHPGVLAAMAATVGLRAPQAKWRNLSREFTVPLGARTKEEMASFRRSGPVYEIPEKPELLFPGIPVMGEADELFLAFGWLRERVQLRGLSIPPNPHLPTNLLFKLRALFGLQARAEIMACLLCSEADHPAQIATLTGYFPRTVQLALNEMARSGHVLTGREAREKRFHLRKEDWGFLAKAPERRFPQWVNWGALFAALDGVSRTLDTPGLDTASPALQAIEFRNVLEKMSPALRYSGLGWGFQTSEEMAGEELVQSLLNDFTQLLD